MLTRSKSNKKRNFRIQIYVSIIPENKDIKIILKIHLKNFIKMICEFILLRDRILHF